MASSLVPLEAALESAEVAARAAMNLLLEERSWNYSDLARLVIPATTPAQIRKLALGDLKISLEWMQRMARAFGVKMSAFLPVEEVALHLDAGTQSVLDAFKDIPAHERPLLARAAKDLVAISQRLGRANTGPALNGNPEMAEAVASRWDRMTDHQRRNLVALIDAAGLTR